MGSVQLAARNAGIYIRNKEDLTMSRFTYFSCVCHLQINIGNMEKVARLGLEIGSLKGPSFSLQKKLRTIEVYQRNK